MDEVTLKIDGFDVTVPQGTTILEAALRNSIYIPHLCYHPDLSTVGVCRLCLVEIQGRGLTISCKASVEQGMVVRTDSPEISNIRRVAAELLIINHHADCLSCPRDADCQLQEVARYIGISEERLGRLRRATRDLPLDTSNPFFDRDPNRCVLCGICIRTCEEINGACAIDFAFRGYDTVVSTFGNKSIVDSKCESCGECVARCPVGALVPKKVRKPAVEVKSICTYCGVGCSLSLGVRGGAIVNVDGDRDGPANHGQLCVKGRYGWDFVNHRDRLTKPLIKRDGAFVEATWDEALDLVAGRLADIKRTSDGDALAVLASAKCTNEENYAIQKFARAALGTRHIDHCARL